MSAQRAHNQVPIPGYRLIERLGKGGFGEVWKCEAPGGLYKAIKFVPGNDGLDQTGSNAEQELRALHLIRSISHPYLLSIERIEIESGSGALMIVTELAECSLHDVLDRYRDAGQGGMPRMEIIRYLLEAAEVLDLMTHDHGLQHLDIKPRNLFLIQKHVKVGDFGLVASLAELHGDKERSLLGGITPLYAAPEIFQNRVSLQCDQYSLAVTYHELLTGDVPIRGRSLCEQAVLTATSTPDLKRLPLGDQPIVARALHRVAEQRYPSCQEFVEALLAASPPSPSSSAFLRPRSTSFDFSLSDMQLPGSKSSPSLGSGGTTPNLVLGAGPGVPVGAGQRSASPAGGSALPRPGAALTRLPQPASNPPPSEILPGYQLQECLQRGAAGELWKATGPRRDTRLVRFLPQPDPESWPNGEDPVARILELDNPSLAELQVLCAGPGRLALVCEAGDSSLGMRLRECQSEKKSGIPRAELLHRLGSIAAVLDELHQTQQIQHLALTPRHIALSRGDVILLEYGLAELFWLPNNVSVAEVNARYAAVELFHGLVSEGADQYSLALMYPELLVGVHPFRNVNQRQLMALRLRTPPDLSMLPGPDRAILMRALSPEPERRFKSCTEFIEALNEATAQIDTATVPMSRVNTRTGTPVVQAPPPWREAVDELVSTASRGHEIRNVGLVHYRSAPGCHLEHRCKARLPPGMAKLKMEGFRERWQADVVTKAENRLLFDIRTSPAGGWRGWFGKAPGVLVEVRFGGNKDEEATPIRVTVEPVDCNKAKAQEILSEVGPAVLGSLQTYLHSQSEKADQERYPLAQRVRVQAPGTTMDLDGVLRDIGRDGLTFFTNQALSPGLITLDMQRAGSIDMVRITARVRDCLPTEDKRYEVEAVF